mgnify:CR=1 FL=1
MRPILVVTVLVLGACGGKVAGLKPVGKPVEIVTPLGLPAVPVPADNPVTAETLALLDLLH